MQITKEVTEVHTTAALADQAEASQSVATVPWADILWECQSELNPR